MTKFQIFLIVVFALVSVGSTVALVRGIAPKLSLATLVIALAACAAAIWPNATTDVARLVGIQRGTDLILYCAVLVMMVGFFLFYIRLRQVRRDLTRIVRHMAIMEASANTDNGASDAASQSANPKGGTR